MLQTVTWYEIHHAGWQVAPTRTSKTKTRWDSFVVGAVVLFSLQSRKLDHTQHVTGVEKAHLLITSNYDQNMPHVVYSKL